MDMTRWLAVPLCGLALAACGSSGSGDKLSKSDLVAKANKICADANKKVEALKSNAKDPAQQTKALDGAASVLEDSVGKLKDLTPPDALKSDYDAFVKGGDAQVGVARSLVQAIKDKNKDKAQKLETKLTQLGAKSKAAAGKAGLNGC